MLDTPDIKKAFDANTKWDVIEFVSERHLGGQAEISQRVKLADAGRRLLEFVADEPFSTRDFNLFQTQIQPLGPVAEEWMAAYRMVPEGRRFPGVASALRGYDARSARASSAQSQPADDGHVRTGVRTRGVTAAGCPASSTRGSRCHATAALGRAVVPRFRRLDSQELHAYCGDISVPRRSRAAAPTSVLRGAAPVSTWRRKPIHRRGAVAVGSAAGRR